MMPHKEPEGQDPLLESFGSVSCLCERCNDELFKQPPATQVSEFRLEAQERSQRLFASYGELRAIIERHEATIQKRWIKKTKSKRESILLQAWPDMPEAHHPDFELLRKQATSPIPQHLEDAFIWPYINQESLFKPKTLPLLLNSRGRHDPCDFAAADGEAMRLGISMNLVKLRHLNGHVMILNGAVSPEEYGQLAKLKQHTREYDWLISGWQFLPGKGLIILEAQERLLSFLVSCCKQILHDIPDQTLTSGAFTIKPPPQLKTDAELDGFVSWAKLAAEAPYRVPSHLDFGQIESLLAAKTAAAEDHVWSLREDPGYFARTHLQFREHQYEMIKDSKGKVHPLVEDYKNHDFLAMNTSDLLARAYNSLEVFSQLERYAGELRMLQEKYSSDISPSEGLPGDYLRAILKFRYVLRVAVRGTIVILEKGIAASPPLRKHFVRDSDQGGGGYSVHLRCQPMGKVEKDLFWLIKVLRADHPNFFSVRMPLAMDTLARLLESEQTAKDLVSPYLANIIGDLFIISQCLDQLEHYQPWANGFASAMKEYQDGIRAENHKRSIPWSKTCAAIRPDKLVRFVSLVVSSGGGGLAYPIDKRRTKENVAILRQSEANLDAFWAKIDELLQSWLGDLEDPAALRLLSQQRIIQRTPEWIEPTKEPKKSSLVPTTDQDADALYKPLSTLYFGPTSSNADSSAKTNTNAKTKTKTKTRGTANAPSSSDSEDDPPEDPSPPDPRPTIAVDARALKVFRTLFFQPSPTATPGEVAWNDFLHAMTSTGFAAEKLYGSVWQFRPVALSVDRNIQFHEPHPSGKIRFLDARRHGRRLNRAFGWDGLMFTLKEK